MASHVPPGSEVKTRAIATLEKYLDSVTHALFLGGRSGPYHWLTGKERLILSIIGNAGSN